MPEGLNYVSSWIGEDFVTCWQVMETDDPSKFQEWIWRSFRCFPFSPRLKYALNPRLMGSCSVGDDFSRVLCFSGFEQHEVAFFLG